MSLPGIGSVSLSGFAHPWLLLTALLPIALVAAYLAAQRNRASRLRSYAGDQPRTDVVPMQPTRWRHLPMVFSVAALLSLTVALAAPTHEIKTPRNRAVIMLVMDVSRSMEADDVSPSRLAAAKDAAKQFAKKLTPGVNLGLVTFSGNTNLLVSPTPDHNATKNALGKLKLADKTATGEGIFAAIDQIQTLNSALGGGDNAPPAHIVLLSDGKQTVPLDPDDPRGGYTAARKAKEEGIPVSTISFGTLHGTVELEGPNGETQRVDVPVDDESLRKIANIAGGEFFTASSLAELNKVYQTLQSQIGYERERGDNSRPWLIAGTLVVLIALLGALLLNRRLP